MNIQIKRFSSAGFLGKTLLLLIALLGLLVISAGTAQAQEGAEVYGLYDGNGKVYACDDKGTKSDPEEEIVKTAVTNLFVEEGVEKIEDDMFRGCKALATVELPNSVTEIGRGAFWDSGLANITLPEGVKKLNYSSFRGCMSLKTIKLPNSLTDLGSSTFANSGLVTVTLPEGLTYVGGSLFNECEKLTDVTLPKGLKEIGGYTFNGCKSLTTIELPSTMTGIGNNAFSWSGLKSITLPEGFKSIGSHGFDNCKSLTSIKLPDSCGDIGVGVFEGSGLKSITLSEGAEWIDVNAFKSCEALTMVTLPSTLTTIYDGAFSNCVNLTRIVISGATPPTLKNYVFGNTPSSRYMQLVGAAATSSEYGEKWQGFTRTKELGTEGATPFITDQTYQGVALEPAIGIAGARDKDYKATYENNKIPGTATVNITTDDCYGMYTGSATLSFTIKPAPLTITGGDISKIYDGKKETTVKSVTFGGLQNGETLSKDTDYTASAVFADAAAGKGKKAALTVNLQNTSKTANYTLSGPNPLDITGTINQANPTYEVPKNLVAAYGQTLKEVTLPEGFSWQDPADTAVGNVGINRFKVTYTPKDTTNYNILYDIDVSIKVSKANPTYKAPEKLTATYGQTLKDVKLPEGFSWEAPIDTAVGNAGSNAFKVTYTPKDTTNYNILYDIDVSIKVSKANPTYKAPEKLTAAYGQTLKDVKLPEGFSWEASIDTAVGNAGSNAFKVTYTPKDTANYQTVAGIAVSIDVHPAPGTAQVSLEGWTYGQPENSPVPVSKTNGIENVIYNYKLKDDADSAYQAKKPTTVGQYTLRAIFAAVQNYEAVTATADFAIEAAEPVLTITPEGGKAIQVGEPITLSIALKGVKEEQLRGTVNILDQTLTLQAGQATVVYTPADDTSKTLTAKYTPASDENYKSAQASIILKAGKKSREPITLNNLTKTYGDPVFTLKPAGGSLQVGESYRYASDNKAVAAVGQDGRVTIHQTGTARITVSVAENIAWNSAAAIMTLTVEKANPNYKVPENLAATYGQTLKDVKLPEGFSWQAPTDTAVGNAGINSFKTTYIPEDTANYNILPDIDISIAVSKAIPTYDVPENLAATYGQTLKDIALPEGFSWQDPDDTAVGNAGTNSFKATYTPEDTANYNILPDIDISIAVSKAIPAYDVPENLTAAYGQTLKDVVLPEGFSWQDPDDTAVGNAGSNPFKVTYIPADTTNYQTVADIEVSIDVHPAAGSAQVSLEGWTYGQSTAIPVPVSETNGTDNVTYDYKLKDAEDSTYQAEKPTNAGQYTLRAAFAAVQNYEAVTATTDFAIEAAAPVLTITADWVKEIKVGEPITLSVALKGVKDETPKGTVKILGKTLTLKAGQATVVYTPADDTSKTVTAEYTPAEGENYKSVQTGITLKAEKKTRQPITLEDTAKIYGDPAFTLLPAGGSLQGGESYRYASDNEAVAIVDQNGEVTLCQAGIARITVSVDESNAWNPIAATMTLTVDKASPAYEAPKELTAVYGQTLKDVNLPQGFSWQAPTETAVGNAGSNRFKVTYTPEDTTNYNILHDIDVSIAVSKAMPSYEAPKDLTAVYGQTLEDVKLPQGFSWQDKDDTAVGNAGSNRFKVTYTPADTTNYQTVADIEVSVDVHPAAGSAQVSQAGWTYGQAGDRPVPVSETNGTDNVTYAYKTKDTADSTYQAEKPTAVGQYTLRAIFAATQNYEAVTATADFAIAAAAPVLTMTPEEGKEIQVGEPITLSIALKGVKDEQPKGTVEILGQTLPLQAGQATVVYTPADEAPKTLTAEYTPAEGENYTAAQASITLAAGKKTRASIILEDTAKTYGDPAFTLAPAGGSLQEGESYQYASDSEAVAMVDQNGKVTLCQAGTAHITVSVAESSAWNPAAATMTLTVGKAKITGVSFEDAAYTEDGAAHKIELTGTLPEGTAVTYENNVQQTPGTYTAKAVIDGGVNYESLELTAVLTINEKPEKPRTPEEISRIIASLPDASELENLEPEEQEQVKETVDNVIESITALSPEQQAQIPQEDIIKLDKHCASPYDIAIVKDTRGTEDHESHIDESDIQIFGGGIAARALGSNVKIVMTQDLPPEGAAIAITLKLYIHQEGSVNDTPTELKTPIVVQLNLPGHVKAQGLAIHHLSPDGSVKEKLVPTIKGSQAAFMTTSFSNFLFVEASGLEPIPGAEETTQVAGTVKSDNTNTGLPGTHSAAGVAIPLGLAALAGVFVWQKKKALKKQK